MPSYSSHLIVNFLGLTAFLMYLQEHPLFAPGQTFFLVAGYFIGTCFLTPDLDTQSEPSNKCGVACAPYRMMFKHRGMSHHVLWGIISRIVYAVLVVLLFVGAFGLLTTESFEAVVEMMFQYKVELLFVAIGLFFSNLFHITLDTIS